MRRGGVAAIVLAFAAGASAQSELPSEPDDTETADAATYGATGVAERDIVAGSGEDPTASATVISLDRERRAVETLDEVLLEAPGARARRTGAFGGFTSLSLRGAEAEQTTVLLGEIPIAAPDGSAFDLSSLPTWLLARVEVYRGGAPAWLSGGAIGGVLRLVPRDDAGRRFEGTLSAGSFDLGQGRAAAAVGDDSLHVTTAAGLTTFGGAFPYVHDDRTAFVPGDDVTRLRQGADFLEASGMMSVRGRIGDVRLESAWLGTGRVGGLSPVPSRLVDVSVGRRSMTRLLGGASATLLDDARGRVQLALGVGLERRAVADPLAQFGQVARSTDDLLWRITARAAGTVRALEWLDLTFVGAYAHEGLSPSDQLARAQAPASARDSGSLAIEGRVFGRVDGARFELRPSGRFEVLDARLFEVREGAIGAATASTIYMPTARLGLVLEPLPGIAVALSGHTASRPPSLVELFGDRSYLVGNTTLRSESSLGLDGGIVVAGAAGPVRGSLDVRGFGTTVSDLIRYERQSQNQSVPVNVARATLAGVEVGLRGAVESWLRVTGALTWLHARDESSDRALPLRPSVTAYARLTFSGADLAFLDVLSAFCDLEYVAESFADPENLVRIGGRARVGLGLTASVLDEHLSAEIVLRDVFDARGVDVLGLPLAGRSLVGSLTLRP